METKSGYTTSEFWATMIVACMAIITPTLMNVFGSEDNFPPWAKVIAGVSGGLLSVASVLGYTISRCMVKNAALISNTVPEEKEETTLVEKKSNGGTVVSVFAILSFLFIGTGCTWTMKSYDQMTVDQIGTTIFFEKADHEITMRDLDSLGADEIKKEETKTRHESELTRLEAWLEAETAKKIEGTD